MQFDVNPRYGKTLISAKLSNFTEIVAEYLGEDETHYKFKNILALITQEEQPGRLNLRFQPFLLTSERDEIIFVLKTQLIAISSVREDIAAGYIGSLSGIEIPVLAGSQKIKPEFLRR